MTTKDEVARRVAERLGKEYRAHMTKLHEEGTVKWWSAPEDIDFRNGDTWTSPFVWDALISSEMRVEELTQELKDLREDTKDYEVQRSRNADKFSREGY